MFKSLLERVPTLTAVATTAALVLSVAHDIGYFGVIGRKFQGFNTAFDYISNAVEWMPLLVMGAVLIVVLYNRLNIPFRSWRFLPTNLHEYRRYGHLMRVERLAISLVYVTGATLGIGGFAFFVRPDIWTFIGFGMLIAFFFSNALTTYASRRGTSPKPFLWSSLYALFLTVSAAIWGGVNDAYLDLRNFSNVYFLATGTGATTTEKRPVQLLRTY